MKNISSHIKIILVNFEHFLVANFVDFTKFWSCIVDLAHSRRLIKINTPIVGPN